MKGANRKELSKLIYLGHRQGLAMNHFCRAVGHSTQCCPPKNRNDFSLHADYMQYLNDFQTTLHTNAKKESVKTILGMRNVIAAGNCCRGLREAVPICDPFFDMKEFAESIPNNPIRSAFSWHHYDNNESHNILDHQYHPDHFKEVLWYEHLDYRPQISYQRRKQVQFHADGTEARLANAANNNKKIMHVNGVKGTWEFSTLRYVSVETDVCFDFGHSLSGLCKNLIELLKTGTSLEKPAKLVASCVNNNTHHPYMHQAEVTYPWKVSNIIQKHVDLCISAILVPASYSGEFQINSIFNATGNLRSKAKIMVFTVLIDFINILTDIPNGYKVFYSMLGSDMNDMLIGQYSDESLDKLSLKVMETVAVFEGIFGDAECKFLLHELIHIPQHMKEMGPVEGWWTFSGERALGFVKQMKTLGGQSFDKTMMNRYDRAENGKISAFYTSGNLETSLANLGLFDAESGICFLTHYVKLLKCIKGVAGCAMKRFEVGKYLVALSKYVLNICGTHEIALKQSPYYRLYSAYSRIKEYLPIQKQFDIYNWFGLLRKGYSGVAFSTFQLHRSWEIIKDFIQENEEERILEVDKCF